MATPLIDASAGVADVQWDQGDPVTIDFTADGAVSQGWGSTFTSQVRRAPSAAGVWLATFAVTATVAGDDIIIRLELTADQSAAVPTGVWWWDLQEVGGVTRVKGRARVKWSVTT